MSATLYYGPIGCGKTAYVVSLARAASQDLGAAPYVLVASSLQVQAFQRRLAMAGGALGVRVGTLPWFCRECLAAADQPPVVPSPDVLRRLMEVASAQAGLVRLAPLADKPGFWDAMRGLIAEAKAAGITAEALLREADAVGSPARMRDLAAVYQAYEDILREQGWLDDEDALRHARDVLRLGAVDVAARWPLVIVDGFDDLSPIQLGILRELGFRTELLVLLTDDPTAARDRYRRYTRTRRELEDALGVVAHPLPSVAADRNPDLQHLVDGLVARHPRAKATGDAVTLMECSDRLSEVRAALRWLKARIVRDGVPPDRAAIIARNLEGYRSFLDAVAREYGLPIRWVGGTPLARSPVIQALLDLLRTQLPLNDATNGPSLEPRLVLETWRSPYLDWSTAAGASGAMAGGLTEGDATYLDELARRYRIIGGLSQWDEAFEKEERRLERETAEEDAWARLEHLRDAWDRFLGRVKPPQGRQPWTAFVGWLEALIGPDPEARRRKDGIRQEPDNCLGVVRRVRDLMDDTNDPSAEDRDAVARDIAALRALKDVLRAMVWMEDALDLPATDYAGFVSQFEAAVRAARYRLPTQPAERAVLALDAAQARGLSFEVAAVIGLAEGEFPALIHEDVFLTDADRDALARRGLPFRLSTESYEAELLMVTLSRATKRLLLTRPRLAENGAPWQPSPYWEEVRRLVMVEPLRVGGETLYAPSEAASASEALALLRLEAVDGWLRQHLPADSERVRRAAVRFAAQGSRRRSPDGALLGAARALAVQFGPKRAISATRLETYASCPYRFFVQHVLRLEVREPIREGLDAAQLGNLYHRILAQAYAHPAVGDPARVDEVLAVLPDVLAAVLDAAPEVEGFRPNAWWRYTRKEIERHVEESVRALAELEAYRPRWFEQPFGRRGMPPLVLRRDDDEVTISGIVDRIDVALDGGLRIIDYKTGGKSDYAKSALERGEKLQLALYGLAARDAMGLGEPVEGFYWHVRQAEPSGLRLSSFGEAPQDAFDVAVEHTWRIVDGIRAGVFAPRPPDKGCPSYCPAAAYCWWYRPGWRGG